MLTFVSWKWLQPNYRTPFTAEHVNVWAGMVERHYPEPHRKICITDDPAGIDTTRCETFPLWPDCAQLQNPSGAHLPSCYRRLRIFSPMATSEMDIAEGDEIVSMDLDVVLVADLRPLFVMREPPPDFMGWMGVGSFNPIVYNGTLFKFRASRMAYLWDDFDPIKSPLEANRARYFGSDQGWMSYKLAGRAPGWTAADGVLSYTSDVRASRSLLPKHARLVSFNGKRKPWERSVQQISPWILRHWRA